MSRIGGDRGRFSIVRASLGLILGSWIFGVAIAPEPLGGAVVLQATQAAQGPDSAQVADTAGGAEAAEDSTASAQEGADTLPVGGPTEPVGAPIVFRGDTIGTLYGTAGAFSPAERAQAVVERLRRLRADGVDPDSITTFGEGAPMALSVGPDVILVVNAQDAAGLGLPIEEATAQYLEMVRAALAQGVLTRTLRSLLIGAGLTILTTIMLLVLLRLLSRWYPIIYQRLQDIQEDRLPSVRFQRLQLISGEQLQKLVIRTAQGSRVVVTAFLGIVYLFLVFSFFPLTRVLVDATLRLLMEPVRRIGLAFVAYLPNLFNIFVILVITFYGLRTLKIFFKAIENRTINVRGFYPDWARTTFNLVRILVIAFGVILVWPYLPASDSDAFRGVAAFLGLLVTFGSAGAVSNAVGGIVMVYMRPFQVGDRVKIADTLGDVVERGLLVTRVRTPKNVETTIPNSMVVGSHIVNYSAIAKASGVILHTSVTIGYDVPWTEVHEALKAAALRSEGIVPDPEPFVLQTALGDYAVSYELNAYTKTPKMMQLLYSRLHTNIQDTFSEAGIEILSPVYHALRDGNLSTIPGPNAPAESSATAFRLRDILKGGGPGGS
jgi:small-conductance mechanosensitive channel